MKNRQINWMKATVWVSMVVVAILFWYGIYRILF